MKPAANTRSDGEHAPQRRIGLWEIFTVFASIGVSGFGGALPIARHALVERRGWLTPAEFTDLLSLCQFLPGANVVNMTVCFGARVHGLAGAATALVGLMSMPVAIAIVLAELYTRFSDQPEVEQAFRGIAAAAAGLVVAMAVRMSGPVLTSPRVASVAAGVFLAMIVARLPLVWVIAGSVPISLAWAWAWSRRERGS